jgi:dihydrofolate synthase/folylpolyglutamate synthase
MIHNYQEALKYLYDNLPIFQRVGAVAYKSDLTNTLKLSALLGDPHKHFKSIHVTGTNGKGSTSHMLASILQEAGYKTGLYTSPHLKEFTERIKVNGEEVQHQFVVDFVNRIQPAIVEIEPSFFEITVVMAFEYFAQQKIDVAIIEVGLGGRLDSTNVITPIASVITNIGWDHKDLLGDTLEKIATEKAGIIKKNIPVVISEKQSNVEDVFRSKAKEETAAIFFAEENYRVEGEFSEHLAVYKKQQLFLEHLKLPLTGFYQRKNLAGVLQTVELLQDKTFSINKSQLQAGLEKVITNTHFKGRWQILRTSPLMICDTGHNVDGVREVVKQLNSLKFKDLHIVLGMVKDKDISDVLALLPKRATYYFCQARIPRALEAALLAEKAQGQGLRGEVIQDVNEAKAKALKNASPDDLIFIGGSTFVVAEIDEL